MDDPYDTMRKACRTGDVALAAAAWPHIQIMFPTLDFTGYWMCQACKDGHLAIVDFLIGQGSTDWDEGLIGACSGDHEHLIWYMLAQGAHVNWGLYGACQGGHYPWIHRMIDLGATDWDQALRGACSSGDARLVQEMIDRGATDFIRALCWACCAPDDKAWDVAQDMIRREANHDWLEAWRWARHNNSVLLEIDMLLRGGEAVFGGMSTYDSDGYVYSLGDWTRLLQKACACEHLSHQHLDLVVRLIQSGAAFHPACVSKFGAACLLNAGVPGTWLPSEVLQPMVERRDRLQELLCSWLCSDVTTLVMGQTGFL